MKFFKLFLVMITFFITSNTVLSQSHEIKIKFIGNCALYMTDGENNLYIDFPYKSGAHNYMQYDKQEIDNIRNNAIFIFTHKHSDHYSKKILKNLTGKIIYPGNINELKSKKNIISNFDIKAFKTSHKVFGIPFRHYSYLITWHNKKIYISGDTGDLKDLREIKNIDWAFLNPWIYENSKSEMFKIDTKNLAIYHLYPNQNFNVKNSDNFILLREQGKIINIPY